jgi:hypothetical protein
MPKPTPENAYDTAQNNYAGALAPMQSEYGQAFRASIPLLYADDLIKFRGGETGVYRGTIGVVITRAAQSQAIVAGRAQYGGDLPLDQQGTIETPDAWLAPFLR